MPSGSMTQCTASHFGALKKSDQAVHMHVEDLQGGKEEVERGSGKCCGGEQRDGHAG